MLSAVLTLMSVLSSWAISQEWYAYKAQLSATPTGAGLVYMSGSSADTPEWQEAVEYEVTAKSGMAYLYAQPAEGWLFAGFATDNIDETGNVVESDAITTTSNPAYVSMSSEITMTDDSGNPADSAVVAAQMPLEPNNYYRAIFAKVVAAVADGQDGLGDATVSKLNNGVGDQIVVAAVGADDYVHFDYWELNGKEVSRDAVLNITVADTARYIAHFTHEKTFTHDFGEGSYYLLLDNTINYWLPDGVVRYSFKADSTQTLNRSVDQYFTKPVLDTISNSGYYWAGTAQVLYAKGQKTFLARQTTNFTEPSSWETLQWSGLEGLNLDTLQVDAPTSYYTFDAAKGTFNRVSGQLAPQTVYWPIANTLFDHEGTAVPEVIRIDVNAVVDGIFAPQFKQQAQPQAVFDLQGRRVSAAGREGIIIQEGKKYFNRKK